MIYSSPITTETLLLSLLLVVSCIGWGWLCSAVRKIDDRPRER